MLFAQVVQKLHMTHQPMPHISSGNKNEVAFIQIIHQPGMFRFLLHDAQSHSNSSLCGQTLHLFRFASICHDRMTSSGDDDVLPKFAIRYKFPHKDHPNLNPHHHTYLASSNALFFCSLHNRMLPPSIFPSLSFSRHSNSRSSTHFPSLLHFSMYSGFNTHSPHATAPRCFSVRFNDAVMKCVARASKAL